MVTWDIFTGIVISFLLMLLPCPVIFVWLWRKRDFPVNCFFSGVTVFIVFYLVLRFYILNALGSMILLPLFLSALAVEGGRLIGFLILPAKEGRDNRSFQTGLSLALGYITAAFLLINAFEMAMNFIYAGALNGWGFLADYLNRFPAESVDQVQVMISATPAYTYLLEVLSLYLAVPVQLFLTLLVFQSYRGEGATSVRALSFSGAVLADFFYFQVGSSVSSWGWAGHLAFLFLTGGIAVWAMARLWREELVDTVRPS